MLGSFCLLLVPSPRYFFSGWDKPRSVCWGGEQRYGRADGGWTWPGAEVGLESHCWGRRSPERAAGHRTPGAEGCPGELARALEPGWHAAAGPLVLPRPALVESVVTPAMKNPLQVPRMIIYYARSVLAESALTALQYFPLAEEFPLVFASDCPQPQQ